MPAFPDTWQFSVQANNSGASASIVVPAPSGNIRRVITSIYLRVVNSGGAATVAFDLAVNVTPTFQWRLTVSGVPTANDTSEDSLDRNVVLVGSPGTSISLTVTVNPGANHIQQMIVKGYDL